ncbi:hypothetical protein SAMN04489712_108270 [Thermomonospora echinospora]|uniref:Peptidase inhibitor family I36 n=1 Tax=Thermomonospora echinospora TaxID=1992 RepID=A0A1H6C2V2_9ACTN|nr:peptidase inhibitor family I36 protein [Thermomonospora echinospora]SEG67271.1 hypothetical protein SAMN04489712_108270 [Thermomonospora echinospora]
MFDQRSDATRARRAGAVLGVAAAALLLAPTAAFSATQAPQALPAGVVKLNDGEGCPSMTLCLYRDYDRRGPAYGIGAGYTVDLSQLPMGSGTAANNISSWVNMTRYTAALIDRDKNRIRLLLPGESLEEPMSSNDSVDEVSWAF